MFKMRANYFVYMRTETKLEGREGNTTREKFRNRKRRMNKSTILKLPKKKRKAIMFFLTICRGKEKIQSKDQIKIKN